MLIAAATRAREHVRVCDTLWTDMARLHDKTINRYAFQFIDQRSLLKSLSTVSFGSR